MRDGVAENEMPLPKRQTRGSYVRPDLVKAYGRDARVSFGVAVSRFVLRKKNGRFVEPSRSTALVLVLTLVVPLVAGGMQAASETHDTLPFDVIGGNFFTHTFWDGQEVLILYPVQLGSTLSILQELWAYEPSSGELRAIAEFPTSIGYAGAFYDGAHAYLLGGIEWSCCGEPFERSTKILRVDPSDGTVVHVGDLPSHIALTEVVWDGTHAYIIGGIDGVNQSDITSNVTRYTPSTGEVLALSPLPKPLFHHSAAWTGTEVVVLGGLHQDGPPIFPSAVLHYDPDTDQWEEGGEIPNDQYHVAGDSFFDGARIYSNSIVECHDQDCTLGRGLWSYDPLQRELELLPDEVPHALALTAVAFTGHVGSVGGVARDAHAGPASIAKGVAHRTWQAYLFGARLNEVGSLQGDSVDRYTPLPLDPVGQTRPVTDAWDQLDPDADGVPTAIEEQVCSRALVRDALNGQDGIAGTCADARDYQAPPDPLERLGIDQDRDGLPDAVESLLCSVEQSSSSQDGACAGDDYRWPVL